MSNADKVTLIQEADIRAIEVADGGNNIGIALHPDGEFSFSHTSKDGKQTDFCIPAGTLLEAALAWIGLKRVEDQAND